MKTLIFALFLISCTQAKEEVSSDALHVAAVAKSHTRKIPAIAGIAGGASEFKVANWIAHQNYDYLLLPVTVDEGETISMVTVSVYGNTGAVLSAQLEAQDDAFSEAQPLLVDGLSISAASTQSNTRQVLSLGPFAEAVDSSARVYLIRVSAYGTPVDSYSGPFVMGAAVTLQ